MFRGIHDQRARMYRNTRFCTSLGILLSSGLFSFSHFSKATVVILLKCFEIEQVTSIELDKEVIES